jgi:hypothetical protein
MESLPRPAWRRAGSTDRGQRVELVGIERREIEREIDDLLVLIFAQRKAEPENFSGREQLYAAHHALRARMKVLDRS